MGRGTAGITRRRRRGRFWTRLLSIAGWLGVGAGAVALLGRPATSAICGRADATGVALPEAGQVQVFAAHPPPRWPTSAQTWIAEMDGLADVLVEATRHNSAVIAGGDFNATVDHAQFRHLLSGGYRDAAEQAGAEFVPTYPTDYPFPPLLTLDHVVTHDVAAHAVFSGRLPGSDHRGLQVELVLPPLR